MPLKTKTEKRTKSKATATMENINELKRLKKEINTTFESASTLVRSSKDKARQALAEAILCGKALSRAKELIGFGGFGRWLKENCKAISERTARNYMALSNRQHSAEQLATDNGLRQAYITLGILSEGGETSATKSTSATTDRNTSSSNTSTRQTEEENDMSTATSPATTPASRALVEAKGRTVKPAITKADVLSRPRYLVNELLNDCDSILHNNSVPISDLEAAVLKPLKDLFESQSKAKRNGKH